MGIGSHVGNIDEPDLTFVFFVKFFEGRTDLLAEGSHEIPYLINRYRRVIWPLGGCADRLKLDFLSRCCGLCGHCDRDEEHDRDG